MRTVTFKSVFEGAARKAGLNPTTLSSSNQQDILSFINEWVKKGVEWEFWPELTPCELRAYRDPYNSATNYPAPTATVPQEVWFPAAERYYQALQATVNHPPATQVAGIWTANAPYWADSATGCGYGVPYGQVLPAPYFASDWLPNTAYVAGAATVVRNPEDDRYYQCITSYAGSVTFDYAKFGILTVFERYVSLDQLNKTPIGEVRGVTRNNPRTNPRYPGPLTFIINNRGILPAPLAGGQVWVEFRIRPPAFTLDLYVNANAQVVGALVYRPDTTGECYKCIQAQGAAAGKTPETYPDYWQKIDLPYVVAEYTKFGTYADILRSDGKTVEAGRAEGKAFEELTRESDTALASQAQYDRATVQV